MPLPHTDYFPENSRIQKTEYLRDPGQEENEDEIIHCSYRGETYYGIPPIKQSPYEWRTAAAFFCTGLAGGSQILATLMDLRGGDDARFLVRTGRYLALGCSTVSTGLLISALHTRQRWYNMLRIFKRTSPMSIGIWSITPFALLSGLAAVGQWTADRGHRIAGRRLGRGFGIPAACIGGIVMTYMGTELEETNMPLWASAYPLMAPLYAALGMSNAVAALSVAAEMDGASDQIKDGLSELSLLFGAAELALSALVKKHWSRQPETRSFEGSAVESGFRLGCIGGGMVLPFALRLFERLGDDRSERVSISAGLIQLMGGLLTQMVLVYGGRESGGRPRDYFEYTRPGSIAGHRHSKARSLPFKQRHALHRVPVKKARSRPRSDGSLVGWGLAAVGAALLVLSVNKGKG